MTNIYTSPYGIDDHELRRIESLTYPQYISELVLHELEFTSLIDAGAGVSTRMAEYAAQKGASYLAFDAGFYHRQAMSELLKRKLRQKHIPGESFFADVRDMPSIIGKADVVHMRLLLIWIAEIERLSVIRKLIAHANRYVVIIENDWRSLKSFSHAQLIQACYETVCELMSLTTLVPDMGEKLEQYRHLLPYESELKYHPRPQGNYQAEITDKLKTMETGCANLGRHDLAARFRELVREMSRKEVKLVPPETVSLVIKVG
jgi:hypothetical protein